LTAEIGFGVYFRLMKIIEPKTEWEQKQYYDLRYNILRKPWNQSYSSTFDEWENKSVHLLMKDDKGEAIAAGRLQINSIEEGQVRSMAVKESEQGRGLGTEILLRLEEEAMKRNMKQIVLDAREGAVDFYKKNGYVVEGNSYVLFGTIVHFRMKKIINQH
jgi:predicted GNAT family N-acyltransferase